MSGGRVFIALLAALAWPLCAVAQELGESGQDVEAVEAVDASDPTKIYSYLGVGLKYNDYTNGESMLEARTTGNLGLSLADAVLFELGYGWHEGTLSPGDDTSWTNIRVRWFHVVSMEYDLDRGYRGWSTQLDLQLAGDLKGTNGQNRIVMGVMPVFALSPELNLYLQLNVVNTWDRYFDNWNGVGPGVVPQLVFSSDDWWPGAQIQILPQYSYFVAGELEGDGSGMLEINVGGRFNPRLTWDITAQKNYDLDLRSLRREPTSKLENDWNVFVFITAFF